MPWYLRVPLTLRVIFAVPAALVAGAAMGVSFFFNWGGLDVDEVAGSATDEVRLGMFAFGAAAGFLLTLVPMARHRPRLRVIAGVVRRIEDETPGGEVSASLPDAGDLAAKMVEAVMGEPPCRISIAVRLEALVAEDGHLSPNPHPHGSVVHLRADAGPPSLGDGQYVIALATGDDRFRECVRSYSPDELGRFPR